MSRVVSSVATFVALAVATVAIGAVAPAPSFETAYADEGASPPPAPAKPGNETPEAGKGAGNELKGAQEQKEALRQARAKKLVEQLEIALVAAKGAKQVDGELVKTLEGALVEAKKLALPIKLAELTEDEKTALIAEVRKQLENDKKDGGGDPMSDWQQQALAKAFDGVDLSEEDQIKSQDIIKDWFQKTQAARSGGDTKALSDLKRDRDTQLEKLVGRKKAQKLINNLNGMSNWGRR